MRFRICPITLVSPDRFNVFTYKYAHLGLWLSWKCVCGSGRGRVGKISFVWCVNMRVFHQISLQSSEWNNKSIHTYIHPPTDMSAVATEMVSLRGNFASVMFSLRFVSSGVWLNSCHQLNRHNPKHLRSGTLVLSWHSNYQCTDH